MPELPEVEQYRKLAARSFLGKKLTDVVVEHDPLVIPSASAVRKLKGLRVKKVERFGKHLVLRIDGGKDLWIHFGMYGRLFRKDVPKHRWPPKFGKVLFRVGSSEVSVADGNRLARVRVADTRKTPAFAPKGPDALNASLALKDFQRAVSSKHTAVKSALMNQDVVSGLGNWMCDEICYQAHLHPSLHADKLSEDDMRRLHRAMKMVVKTSVRLNADYSRFPKDWLFHARGGCAGKRKAPRDKKVKCIGGKVKGHQVKWLCIGGRTTAFVPDVQRK
jgi:formamidopyrimidine-DNA glycosylase